MGGFVPISVAIRQRVGDEFPGQQEESPEQVNDTAGGQEEEGGAEGDARLVQQLQEKTGRGGDHRHDTTSCRLHSCEQRVDVSHLDDEEECRGRVEGPVVESDNGGAMRAEQVSYLQRRHLNKNRCCIQVSVRLCLNSEYFA